MAHSFIQDPKSSFFLAKRDKKNTARFFFSINNSWAIHSILGSVSLSSYKIGLYFFPQIFGCFFSIFFPWKVYLPFFHSISRLFFSVDGKKTAFSFIQSIFSKSVVNIELSQRKKIRYLW